MHKIYTHQRNVNQLYQPSAGHKSISQIPYCLNHVDQLKKEIIYVRLRAAYFLKVSKRSYIIFSFSDHRGPSLAGW